MTVLGGTLVNKNLEFVGNFRQIARTMTIDWENIPDSIFHEMDNIAHIFGKGYNNVHYIILFGSHARGVAMPTSDIDIMIVHSLSDDKAIKMWKRVKDWGYKNLPKSMDGYGHLEIPKGFDVVMEPMERFVHKLNVQAPFFMDVIREGILFYSDGTDFPQPEPITPEQRYELAKGRFEASFYRAEGFFAGIDFYFGIKNYPLVAFHCHQVAENALKAMLLCYDAYLEKTHDIEMMLRRSVKRDEGMLLARYHQLLDIEAKKLAFAMAAEPLPDYLTQPQIDWVNICNSYLPPRYDLEYEGLPINQLRRMQKIVKAFMDGVKVSCEKKLLELKG